MNVALPFDENPYAFYGLAALMVAMIVGLVLFFRRRKWM
jgi:LPXTG-motif cell wall-anchored protein